MMLISGGGLFSGPSSQQPHVLGGGSPYHIYKIDDDLPPEAYPNDEQFYDYCEDPGLADVMMEETIPPPHSSTGAPAPPPPPLFCNFQSNRRMMLPYKRNAGAKTRILTTGLPTMRDEPLVVYRFFEFYCRNCNQGWLSPLLRAKDGCYCRICHHFILPRGIRHSFTPYLGKETCYGKYNCHVCNRGWSSYKSLSNCPDQCFECLTLVYPYYQIAHSVLYQKIHKNAFETTGATSPVRFGTPPTTQHHARQDSPLLRQQQHEGRAAEEVGANGTIFDSQQSRQVGPRKISSISGLLTGVQAMRSKKRLNCLSNVPFVHQSTQQVRREMDLKPCYSEPIIRNETDCGCDTTI